MKGELLEGGLRVPALMRWPNGIAKGLVSDQVTITMDWAPTLLKLAGAAPRGDRLRRRRHLAAGPGP